jgi:hypothetical protein
MIAFITSIIPDLWGYAAAFLGGILLIGGAWWSGRRSGAVARDLRDAKAEAKAHERINHAESELGRIHSDADVIDGLRDAAKRIGN